MYCLDPQVKEGICALGIILESTAVVVNFSVPEAKKDYSRSNYVAESLRRKRPTCLNVLQGLVLPL